MFGIIYKITNKINNKIYIGQTTSNLRDRWIQHCCAARNNYKTGCSKLYRAINKYGPNNFTIEIIHECLDKEELDYKEQSAILKYNSIDEGYNLTSGGFCGNKQSKETTLKKSKAHKKWYIENPDKKEQRIKGLRKYWKDRTPDVVAARSAKISAAWTPEKRKKQGELTKASGRAIFRPEAVEAIKVPLIIIHPDGQEELFSSCQEACHKYNLTASAISMCLKGDRPRHKGFRFKKQEKLQ